MKGQFFIITAVLVAGLLLSTTTMLASSQTVDYSTVLEGHSTDIVENLAREIRSEWWNTSWDWRKRVVVEESSGSFLNNESVAVTLDARRSRVNDTCADIRVVSGGETVPWINTTACDIDTYRSGTSAVGRWKLDSGSGDTAVDSTGNGHEGTLVGDPYWVSGRFQYGLKFDGDDRVEVSGFPNMDGSFTAMGWVRSTGSGTVVADDDNDNGWFLAVDGGSVNFTVRGEGSLEGGSVGDGNWHHLAGVLDTGTGTQRLYVDGELVDSTSAGSPATDSGPLTFGGQGTGQGLEGSLDDVRVYNRSLSTATIEGIARNGIGLNVSADLSPLEERTFQIYYGNPSASDPGYSSGSLQFTDLDERPEVSVGPYRGIREVVRKLQERVERLDASLGASIELKFRRGCNLLTLRTPRIRLEKELC